MKGSQKVIDYLNKSLRQVNTNLGDMRNRRPRELRTDVDALSALGLALGDHQSGFDCLAEPDFVREDASAFSQPPEREDDRVDLMRVRVNSPAALRRGVAPAFGRAAQPEQLFGQQAPMNRMRHGITGSLPEQ